MLQSKRVGPVVLQDIIQTVDPAERLESSPQLHALREKGVVAYANGVLYVARAYAVDAGVGSLEAYCKRIGLTLEKKLVDIDEITRLNSTVVHAHIDSKGSQAIQTFIELTRHAVNAGASDIHIVIDRKGTTIKQRIHGDLRPVGNLTRADGENLCTSIYQALTDVADPHYTPSRQQDGRIPNVRLHTLIREKVSGIRVATTPLQNGSLMVLRILYESGFDEARGLTDLGYRQDQVDVIENLKRRSTGINLIVGPTGSGKSTTLKMILSALHRDYDGRIHILTVEDPPEYPIPGVNQIPVTNAENSEERHSAFNDVVRGSMRLDPDCIMIGEIRDEVTASLALNAAMTGHRVWTTLHANTALGAIQRLVVLNVDINLLAEPSVFRGVCSQRLVKMLCPQCRIPFGKADEHRALSNYLQYSGLRERMEPIIRGYAESIHFRGDGCVTCNHTGTVGRTVVAEIIEPDSAMMSLILERKWIQARTSWLRRGGTTMMMHAIEKIRAGIVDPRAVEDVLDPIFVEEV
ncbi:secretion system protein E [Methylocaldum sp. BRCS4]|jgi:general secretion pathway protein E|uniref:GspE/PulE family protein n=1 Tax=Methylocaldum sp. GT1BW TaxID=3438964 RepID=UPI0012EC9794|nr:secretion system protein E [Methylocaldum sp. BRCS4]